MYFTQILYEFNEVKYNLIFSFLTCNATQYKHSLTTLFCLVYLHENFFSGAYTLFLCTSPSGYHSLSVQFILKLVLWSTTCCKIMQRQMRLLHTYLDYHADSDIFVRNTSRQFHSNLNHELSNREMHNFLLHYSDVSVPSRAELMNLFSVV